VALFAGVAAVQRCEDPVRPFLRDTNAARSIPVVAGSAGASPICAGDGRGAGLKSLPSEIEISTLVAAFDRT